MPVNTTSPSSSTQWPTAHSDWPGPEPDEGDDSVEPGDPPWKGWIATTGDALLILEAARRGLIPRVTRRLVEGERKMIRSGSVFVFDEGESGIKRWTDGYYWSPSRILGNFLLYRQTAKKGGRSANAERSEEGMTLSRPKSAEDDGPSFGDKTRERSLVGSLTHNAKFMQNGLMKKTFFVNINGVSQHLISYYKVEDVQLGRLNVPSSLPELASLDISPEYLDKAHFRHPPKIEMGSDGVPRYQGEADDVESPMSGLRSGPMTREQLAPPRSRYDPYGKATGRKGARSPERIPVQVGPPQMSPHPAYPPYGMQPQAPYPYPPPAYAGPPGPGGAMPPAFFPGYYPPHPWPSYPAYPPLPPGVPPPEATEPPSEGQGQA